MSAGHAERLLPMISAVLDDTGLRPDALDRIAVTVGPGTFTGTRIAIAAARALALVAKVPVVTMTSLKLMAMSQDANATGANELAIATDAASADAQFAGIKGGTRFEGARAYYHKRLFEMEELGLNPRRFNFAAGFGREIEYYTGFTFQIDAETKDGPVTVAGGGRYDNLLADMGAASPIPAVGCAIHTDRLRAVLS